jgi:hypothetical protein
MITNFTVVQANTVPDNYSWDIGIPLESGATGVPAYTTENYVSGYAPAVNVIFNNISQSNPNYPFVNYVWNFGDLYHDSTNNVSLTCATTIQHLYIMPGIYTVTLEHVQSRTRTILETDPLLCRGKFDVRWFWLEQESARTESLKTRITWDETSCTLLPGVSANRWKPKWWDNEQGCFEKYCRPWSWYSLRNLPGREPIIWNDTGTNDKFQKKWMYEANETQCDVRNFQYLDTVEVIQGVAIKVGVVEVKELPPTAGITCLTSPLTGITPYTIQLSPSACIPGSFPIDRIDWDFGDGSPIKTVTRFTDNLNDPDLIYSNIFFNDVLDVRNFDALHTYTRNANSYSVFYPSLTCYSANTSTSDSCCTTIGPILFQDSSNIQLVKVRNTIKGNLYAFDVEKNIAFHTDTFSNSNASVTPNIPPTVLRDSILLGRGSLLGNQGNPGSNYPPEYVPSCSGVEVNFVGNYLSTEDNNPFDGDTIVNSGEEGLPLTTEGNQPILP